ncbi:MAG: hypothetical protein H0V09_08545 [Gemmatimonadetes bacterium]|nr:hypothetical protein [Gemmatimonadota bacterium]
MNSPRPSPSSSSAAFEDAWSPRFGRSLRESRLSGQFVWRAALLLMLAVGVMACDDDDDDGGFSAGRPDAPTNLTSFTGDGQVVLVWDPSDDEVESYNVYALIDQTDEFELIGVTTSAAFLDDDVVNGDTYFYKVTALDFDGDESNFSNEAFDTPRPDELNVLIESAGVDPAEAGFDLTTGQVVSATSSSATFRFEEIAGVPRLVPANGAEVQSVGFVDALSCRGAGDCIELNFAPESGYFPETAEALVGAAYVFRIPRGGDRLFGAVRISHTAPGVLVFDWAFQTDANNRELLRRPLLVE